MLTSAGALFGLVLCPVVAKADTRAVSGQDIVEYARKYVGVPYVWGGQTMSGIDCSGLVQSVYGHFHISLPRTTYQQATIGVPVSRERLVPGCLVFFNTTGDRYSHVGIYVGDGKFISATSSKGVRICKIDNPYYWGPRFTHAVNPFSHVMF